MSDGPPSRDLNPIVREIEQVVELLDSDARAAGAVRWLRSRLPGEDLAVHPLALGPGLATDLAVRLAPVAAHRPSVLRELGFTALQLWQAQHAAARPDLGSNELAVMFTDIEGFSEWTLEVGDTVAVAALERLAAAVEPVIVARGTLVKRLGDGVMAVFADPDTALEAALVSRDAVDQLEPDDLGGHRLRQRAGIHLGRPVLVGGDYFGRDVNVAARVADAAAGGEVCVSDVLLRTLTRSTVTFSERRVGVTRKGVPDRVSVFVAGEASLGR